MTRGDEMKQILAIDDYKECYGATKIARTFEEGCEALFSNTHWDELWLDYDLGGGYDCDGGSQETGLTILNRMEELMTKDVGLETNPTYTPPEIIRIISQHSKGKEMYEKICKWKSARLIKEAHCDIFAR